MMLRFFHILYLLPVWAIVTHTVQAQQEAPQLFVCFYAAPIQKSMSIMHDVYQGIARSTDQGASWESLAYKTSLMNDVAMQPGTDHLFAASEYGVLRSTDNGARWKQLNGWEIQTVFRVAFVGRDIWMATPRGPMQSTDGGESWMRRIEGLQPLNATYVSDISIHDSDMLISTADGIYHSTDGGAHWQPSGLSGQEIDALVRHPRFPETIAAINHGNGLWLSNDNGRTWQERNGDLYSKKIQALAFDPMKADGIYVGMSDYPVCKTTDGGATWKTINRGMTINSITAITVDASDPQRIYAGSENGLWLSSDGGENWQASTIRYGYIRSIVIAEAL